MYACKFVGMYKCITSQNQPPTGTVDGEVVVAVQALEEIEVVYETFGHRASRFVYMFPRYCIKPISVGHMKHCTNPGHAISQYAMEG